MSEMTFAVLDLERAIYARRDAGFANSLIPALSDDPETIQELGYALRRFLPPDDPDERPLDAWSVGDCDDSFDAGLCLVDLAARLIVYESSDSEFLRRGRVTFDDEGIPNRRARWIPYRVSDAWRVTDRRGEWRSEARRRRQQRQAAPPLDTRAVLYTSVVEFVVDQCRASRGGVVDDEGRWTPPTQWQWRELPGRAASGRVPRVCDAVAEIHARWLMTPRDDLRRDTPRDVLHAERDEVARHVEDREAQWTAFGECPIGLWPQSAAYRYGGYGDHEIVLYYYLLRHLIRECWTSIVECADDRSLPMRGESIDRVRAARETWLHTPDSELLGGETPARVIDFERSRLPFAGGPDDMVDDDCPLCQMMADCGPGFWHLDGCSMDDEFPFSLYYKDRDEWDAEQRCWADVRSERESCDAIEEERHSAFAEGDLQDGNSATESDEVVESSAAIWKSSHSRTSAGDSPALVLFGLGTHLSEVIVELKKQADTRVRIDSLNRDFGNLRDAVETADGTLVDPVTSQFCEHLAEVAKSCPDLAARCEDLEAQLRSFAGRLAKVVR